jgi:hypothetical protein
LDICDNMAILSSMSDSVIWCNEILFKCEWGLDDAVDYMIIDGDLFEGDIPRTGKSFNDVSRNSSWRLIVELKVDVCNIDSRETT